MCRLCCSEVARELPGWELRYQCHFLVAGAVERKTIEHSKFQSKVGRSDAHEVSAPYFPSWLQVVRSSHP